MKQDLLAEDKPIEGQKFVCLSFLDSSKIHEGKITQLKNEIKQENDFEKKCHLYEEMLSLETTIGVKIRGVFTTEEKAHEHAKYLQETDRYHNVYVGDVGKWLPFNDESRVEKKVYAEKELNELMESHMENQKLAQKEMDKRKSSSVKV